VVEDGGFARHFEGLSGDDAERVVEYSVLPVVSCVEIDREKYERAKK